LGREREEGKYIQSGLMRKHEGIHRLGNLGVDGKIILK
jgi:hypothetical protein